jgi:hypothetical protein
MASEPQGQLRTEVRAGEGDGSPTTVISSGREVEQGARSVLLLAEGLFRLDVVPEDDTIQTILRNLSPQSRAEFRFRPVGGGVHSSETAPRSTGRFGGEVVLVGEDGSERAVASILVGSVCHLERGVTSFTGQARLL